MRVLLIIALLAGLGCSAKALLRFEKFSDKACTQVEKYAGTAAALADGELPEGAPQLVVDLGLDVAVERCRYYRDRASPSPEPAASS